MAEMLRDRYNLKTLRCWLGYQGGGGERRAVAERVLRTQLYEGPRAIGEPVDTPLGALELDADGYPPAKAWIPDLKKTAIAGQLRTAASGNPAAVWLHIPQDSYALALLPWEEMTSGIMPVPLLRIGNFVRDPYTPAPAPVIAVCASQPVGDGPYQLNDFVLALLSAIEDAARWSDTRPKVSVFADAPWIPAIEAGLASVRPQRATVEVVRPEPTPATARPASSAADRLPRGESVWLKWMGDHFTGRTVDIVHFVTPGWLADNHGAVALAETPTSNVGGGEFVGAAELAAFYDRLGCSGMAFSSPHMPEWEWGQRMLAFELSWLRPGPVLVFEHGASEYSYLATVYHVLLGGGSAALGPLGHAQSPPQLTCHPQLLEGPGERRRQDTLKADPPVRDDLLSRRVEQAMAQLEPTRKLSRTEEWEAAGAAEALAFVQSLN